MRSVHLHRQRELLLQRRFRAFGSRIDHEMQRRGLRFCRRRSFSPDNRPATRADRSVRCRNKMRPEFGSDHRSAGPTRNGSFLRFAGIVFTRSTRSGHSGGCSSSFFSLLERWRTTLPCASRISSVTSSFGAALQIIIDHRAGGWVVADRLALVEFLRIMQTQRSLRLIKDRSRPALIAAFTWRNGVMSSSTQNERPCVATTRSSSFTTRS